MESFIFTIIIWLLLIPEFLIKESATKIIILVVQIILLIAQWIYAYFKFKS